MLPGRLRHSFSLRFPGHLGTGLRSAFFWFAGQLLEVLQVLKMAGTNQKFATYFLIANLSTYIPAWKVRRLFNGSSFKDDMCRHYDHNFFLRQNLGQWPLATRSVKQRWKRRVVCNEGKTSCTDRPIQEFKEADAACTTIPAGDFFISRTEKSKKFFWSRPFFFGFHLWEWWIAPFWFDSVSKMIFFKAFQLWIKEKNWKISECSFRKWYCYSLIEKRLL